jgi:predicted transcriptional regulator
MDHDNTESFVLSPKEEASLREAIAEADAGDFVDGEEFLRKLRARRSGSGGTEEPCAARD